jgi:hypothetical protein
MNRLTHRKMAQAAAPQWKIQRFVAFGPTVQVPPLLVQSLQNGPSGPPDPTHSPFLHVVNPLQIWQLLRKPSQPFETIPHLKPTSVQVSGTQTLHWLFVQIWPPPQVPGHVTVSPQLSSVTPQLFAPQTWDCDFGLQSIEPSHSRR